MVPGCVGVYEFAGYLSNLPAELLGLCHGLHLVWNDVVRMVLCLDSKEALSMVKRSPPGSPAMLAFFGRSWSFLVGSGLFPYITV